MRLCPHFLQSTGGRSLPQRLRFDRSDRSSIGRRFGFPWGGLPVTRPVSLRGGAQPPHRWWGHLGGYSFSRGEAGKGNVVRRIPGFGSPRAGQRIKTGPSRTSNLTWGTSTNRKNRLKGGTAAFQRSVGGRGWKTARVTPTFDIAGRSRGTKHGWGGGWRGFGPAGAYPHFGGNVPGQHSGGSPHGPKSKGARI